MGSNRIFPVVFNEPENKTVALEMDHTYSFASQRSLSTSYTQTSKGHCFADALIKVTGYEILISINAIGSKLLIHF